MTVPGKATTFKLNTGAEIPALGIGTYTRKPVPGQAGQAVEWAIDCGYRHIDQAILYNNAEEVGAAIAKKIKEGIVTREQLYVNSKLWNDKRKREDVIPELKKVLGKLGLDYVDSFLIHWPLSFTETGEDGGLDFVDTWHGMEEAYKLGLTRAIGVSNFNKEQLTRILKEGTIVPAINQVEVNATMKNEALVQFCKSHGIQVTAYTPLGAMSDMRHDDKVPVPSADDPILTEVGKKYGKTPIQVVLRWLVQRGIVCVPKSFTKSRIEHNIEIFDFQLTDEEMKIVDQFDKNHRCVPALQWKSYKNFPY